MMMIECQYRTHSTLWVTVSCIESITKAKNGSAIRTISGTTYDVLDTPEEIEQKIADIPARLPSLKPSVGQQEREEE